MEDVIRENLCNFCENYKRNDCMKIKGNEQKYTCENYIFNKRNEPYKEFDYEIRSNDENYNTINSKKQKKQSAINKKSKNKKNDVNTI